MVETDKAVTPSKETDEIHQAEIQKLKKPKEDAEETDGVEKNEKKENNNGVIPAQEAADCQHNKVTPSKEDEVKEDSDNQIEGAAINISESLTQETAACPRYMSHTQIWPCPEQP